MYSSNSEQKKRSRPQRLPVVLSQREQLLLLAQPNPKAPTGIRNLCIMHLMLYAGLRVNEVINLGTKHIDFMSGQLLITHGKNGKERYLWLNSHTLDTLLLWRPHRQHDLDFFFHTLAGGKLSDRYIRAMVKRYATRAGIEKDIHPHTLRHTFATDLFSKTKNIRLVQKALGHSNVNTTQLYTHLVDGELEDALKNFKSAL